VEFNPRQIVNI